MNREFKDEIKNEVISWLKVVVFAVVVSLIITNFIIVNAKVPSGSMENTIMTNDRVVANRLEYKFRDPKRYDIVVFPAPDEPETLFVKRIIGLPGDTIVIEAGEIYINGSREPLDTSFVKGPLMGDFGPYEVPEDSYFMLGDNRNNSKDARSWQNKYVNKKDILGRVVFRYYPSFKSYL